MDEEFPRMTNEAANLDRVPKLDLTIVYEDGEEGWVIAQIPAVPGVLSQGRNREEARENVLDALALMLSPEPDEDREHELVHLTVS
ncbi:MAG TPA: type II toxin-antitoxin system HicB family antitoxin [Solirubrobacterales bacterium]|jgi:predicted RNase H-like HicB family nuclease|nr:type II toxin-antitoxin system HicB family antitoxin [Solirubrobacterales bacterium]